MSTTICNIILGVGRSEMPYKGCLLHLADNWPVSNSRNHDGAGLIEKAYRAADGAGLTEKAYRAAGLAQS